MRMPFYLVMYLKSTAYSKYGCGELLLVDKDVSGSQLVSLFPGDSSMERRLLKISTEQKPDLNTSVLEELLPLHMPFSRETQISFESDYDFPLSTFHAEFRNTSLDRPLAAPPDDAIGSLTTTVKPYSSSETPLPRLKEDIDRLKRLCWAYQNEVSWTSSTSMKSLDKDCWNQLIVEKLGARNPELPLSDSEQMWEILKDVPDRRTASSCLKFTLDFLRQNRSSTISTVIDANDFTQFTRMVRQTGTASHFEVLGLKMLIELGFYKTTNDCLHIIRSVSSELSNNFAVKYLQTNGEATQMSVEERMALLHHLYKIACLTTALLAALPGTTVEREISLLLMNISESATEWEAVVVTEEFELPHFVYNRQCQIPVSSLVVKLFRLNPRMWTVRFSSNLPMKIEKRLVYENVGATDGTPLYLCHLLELVNTVWLYEN